jgi:hypothetical protein
VRRGLKELIIGGEAFSPRLHLAMRQVVVNQLWDDDPPQVWQAAGRLIDLGYERHVLLHMIAGVVTEDVWRFRHEAATKRWVAPNTAVDFRSYQTNGRDRSVPARIELGIGVRLFRVPSLFPHCWNGFLVNCLRW